MTTTPEPASISLSTVHKEYHGAMLHLQHPPNGPKAKCPRLHHGPIIMLRLTEDDVGVTL